MRALVGGGPSRGSQGVKHGMGVKGVIQHKALWGLRGQAVSSEPKEQE